MSRIEREVVLEALSALSGFPVKPLDKTITSSKNAEMTVDNFLSLVFGLISLPAEDLETLSSLLEKLSLNFQKPETEVSPLHKLFVDVDDFFDPRFDFDFRRPADDSQCSRGEETYDRPWGWYRFALKVLDKYPDGNTWLGPDGWRSHSAPGEWPVSFHGTSIEGAKGIARSHFKPGPHEKYGRGVYSTPDIDVADAYAMDLTFKSKTNGKTYKVIMQNRINPEKRVRTVKKDYWLIPVPERASPAEEKMIVESSIRPYGILIKESDSFWELVDSD